MRLKVTQQSENLHKEIVLALGWSPNNELITASDDSTVQRWGMDGSALGKLCDLEQFTTDLHWFPTSANRNKQKKLEENFVIACTDGKFLLCSQGGRVEKAVEAHKGAVITLRWNYEGTALATGGEDGVIKVWSRAGMLRSTLVQKEHSIYSLAWSPDSDSLLFTYGKDLIIKPLQPSFKQTQWKAHEGLVLKVDWNPVTNLIVSGAEDCRFKIWDSYGRLLFQSTPIENVITAVSWAPNGKYFVVGSYALVRFYDKTGWCYSREKPNCGSIFNFAWTSDGTQVAAAGGNGAVCFGSIIERQVEYDNLEFLLAEPNKVVVRDVLSEMVEELDFRDRVIEMAAGWGQLVVATSTQCCIYTLNNWNTPHMFDLKDTVNLIIMTGNHFVLLDKQDINIYSYDGHLLSSPKFAGLRPEFLSAGNVSVSNDTLAVIDKTDNKQVRLFEIATGKPIAEPIKHPLELVEVQLSQTGQLADRKLTVIDRNQDLYITPVNSQETVKVATMIDSAIWNDSVDMLAAVGDDKLTVWFYPQVVYYDKDMLSRTRLIRDASEFGKTPSLLSFRSTRCTLRRSDGAVVTSNVSPYQEMLANFASQREWDLALRLCRYVKSDVLWACLAAMAVEGKELNTAEVAYAAINEVDKLQFILHIKEIPSVEGRAAELLLFRRRPQEAVRVLVQAGLIYRAIKLYMRLFNWDSALDLAVQYKTHVDTVLAYRQRFLEQNKLVETNKRFLQYAGEVAVDWTTIKEKIAVEKEKERQRPGSKPYQ